jgi:DNA replication ATP-dependent helicase Dna2
MFQIGSIIDNSYRLNRELGRGGFGVVYAADELGNAEILGPRDTGESQSVLRTVALKLLSLDPSQWRRFRTEVHALCRLNHPNIVQVYTYGRAGVPYIVMELVEGRGWNEILKEPGRTIHPQQTLRTLIQVADALKHAHEREVIHRDLKPHNILITPDREPKIVDFGLSLLMEREAGATQRIGTPGYLAPEIIEADPTACDHRADIYSLGALIHAAFAGSSPFAGGNAHAIVRAQSEGNITLSNLLPTALHPLVRQCLERDRAARPRTASLVADELRRILATTGIVRIPRESGDPLAAVSLRSDTATDRKDLINLRIGFIEDIEHAQRGAGVRGELIGSTEEASQRFFAYEAEFSRMPGDIYDQLRRLSPGTEVSILGAVTRHNQKGDTFYSVDTRSVLVVEPYFPLTVTNIIKVEGVRAGACPSRHFVDLRQQEDIGKPIVVGNLVHQLLSDLFERNIDPGNSRALHQRMEIVIASQRLELVAAGISDARLPDLRNEILGHLAALAEWASPQHTLRSGNLTEARRFSPRYGLDGKFDIMLEGEKHLRILELKTGKHAMPDHERQLRAYMLIWGAYAEARNKEVEGRLLYSGSKKELGITRVTDDDVRQLASSRNEIVLLRKRLAEVGTEAEMPRYDQHPALCRDDVCRYRATTCKDQQAALPPASRITGAVTLLAARYYSHFVKLLEREHWAISKRRGDIFREHWADQEPGDVRALRDVPLKSVNEKTGELTFDLADEGLFNPEDTLLLHQRDFASEPMVLGRVRSSEGASLVVSVDSVRPFLQSGHKAWSISRDERPPSDKITHGSLFAFVAANDPARRDAILSPGKPKPLIAADALSAELQSLLNKEQAIAVANALREDLPVFRIEGPPGTGKSQVVATAIAALVASGKRVLLTANTHTAVDNILPRLVRLGVPGLLRVGSRTAPSAELAQALHDKGLPDDALTLELLADDASGLDDLRAKILASRVIACTTHACAKHPVFSVLRAQDGPPQQRGAARLPIFDVAIIDEASQLIEPLSLAAINLARRTVLVGDQQQLPPVVTADDALSSAFTDDETSITRDLAAIGVAGLDRSLFARLAGRVPSVMLRTQYRMNNAIQAFPSRSFYSGLLQPDAKVAERNLPIPAEALAALDPELRRRLDPERPLVWVDDPGKPKARSCSQQAAEVARTAAALWRLWQHRTEEVPRDAWLGIVTPFRNQCTAIRNALVAELGEEAALIEVDTTDKFQGREKEAILFSLVRNTWSDFVFDERRINVSLTRARSKLIVFGPKELGRRMHEVFAPADPPGEDLQD